MPLCSSLKKVLRVNLQRHHPSFHITFTILPDIILFIARDAFRKKNLKINITQELEFQLIFIVNLENCYSGPSNVTCWIPQGSILEPLLLLIFVNDMPQAVKSNLFPHADYSCLVLQGKNVIKTKLDGDFTNICEWFVGKKLSIDFGEYRAKSILFASKRKIKEGYKSFKITYKNIQIKQPKVKY